MSPSSTASGRPNAALAAVLATLRAIPILRSLVETRSSSTSPLENDPWNDPGGMSDEMERAFIAAESRRW